MSKAKGKGQVEAPPPEPVHIESVAPVSGSGEFVLPDGSIYVGEWKEIHGKKVRDGHGKMTNGPEQYIGQWVEDRMEGQGQYTFASGATFTGAFKNNVFEGEGEYTFADGAIYLGGWHQNKMHGKGIYTDKDKITFKGQFMNGLYDSGRSYVSVRNH